MLIFFQDVSVENVDKAIDWTYFGPKPYSVTRICLITEEKQMKADFILNPIIIAVCNLYL